jgi:hypothetical protein
MIPIVKFDILEQFGIMEMVFSEESFIFEP